MKIIEDDGLTGIVASDGMTLTNGEIYANTVYLGIFDSIDNWHEIPENDIPPDESGME